MPIDENNEIAENTIGKSPEEVTPDEATPVEAAPAQEPATFEVSGAAAQPDNTYAYVYKAPKKKKGWTTGKVVALALVTCIFGSLLGLFGAYFGMQLLPADKRPGGVSTIYQGDREPGQVNIENVNTGKVMTPADVYAANVNATVGISTSITTTNYWGYPTTSAVSGSGFILTSDGYIATNYHVVENGSSIRVTLFNGQEYEANLMGYNENKDIAVLKVNATGLPCVVLGNSDNVLVGEQIMAIGNPLGELTFSLSVGVVSAVNREVLFAEGAKMKLIQTDCAINSGNSGGAMFNAYGEVVGIATGKYSGETGSGTYIDNIGFAVPINDIKAMVQQVIEKGYASRAYLGITFTDVDERMLFYGVPKGASISSVDKASPAEQGGLKAYDVITAFNGEKVENKEDLVSAVDACSPNQKVIVTIYRSGETLELEITLGEKILASEY